MLNQLSWLGIFGSAANACAMILAPGISDVAGRADLANTINSNYCLTGSSSYFTNSLASLYHYPKWLAFLAVAKRNKANNMSEYIRFLRMERYFSNELLGFISLR